MSFEMTTRLYRSYFVEWARPKPEVVVLSADLTSSCEADLFRESLPERFFSLGMAEQNMVGFAGGMTREGYTPWLHTFAVFLTRRVFDQVAMSVAYPNLPVRFVGFLPGITTPGGVTHQAIDDIALMRVMPNMTILEVGDATEVTSVLDVAHAIDGPVYIRQLRGIVPRLFPESEPMKLNRARVLHTGDDVTLISSGICTEPAMRAVKRLGAEGVSVNHIHVSTLKPFDDDTVRDALASTKRGVVTVENHSIIGGLGSAVAETMAEMGLGVPLKRLGLQDVYAHGASREYLMIEYGIDEPAIARAIAEPLNLSLKLTKSPACANQKTDEDRVEDL